VKALVLGATGRIGNAIARELLNHGAAVSAVSRRVQPPENLIDLDLDYRSGDANRPGQIESWVAGHELVVDAAAPYHLWLFQNAPSAARLASAERQLSALLESVARHNCAFAFVGSQATDDRQRPMLGRAQARILRLLHPYFELKRRMESKIRRAMRDGLRAVIVSPTFCIGPGDISDPDLAFIPMTVNGALPATNSHALNVMDVRDVAALLAAAVAKSAFGSSIAVVGHNTTLEMLTDLICRTAGVPRPRWYTPSTLAAAAAYANELINASGLREPDYPSVGALLMLEQGWALPNAAQRKLGVELRPLSRSVTEAIDWYRRRGVLHPRPTASAH
jgi:nucleoside-diphosphate-sugar epimerase